MERKPSIKRKPLPPIKQTRTSAFRMLKANPLMMYDKETVKQMGFEDRKKIPKTVDILGISQKEDDCAPLVSQSFKVNHVNTKPYTQSLTTKPSSSQCSKIKANCVNTNSQTQPPNQKPCISHNLKAKNGISNFLTKATTRETNKNFKQPINYIRSNFNNNIQHHAPEKTSMLHTKNPPRYSLSTLHRQNKRRSKSAESFDSNKLKGIINCQESVKIIEASQSVEDIPNKSLLNIDISPINERVQQIVFKTPIAYNRRSVAHTPLSGRQPIYRSSSSTPAPSDLQKRLNDWLTRRGKSISSFHHLKCFGIEKKTAEQDDENKENIETDLSKSESYENLCIKVNDEVDTPNQVNSKNFQLIARDALDDLHKLIQDGYPIEQCEAWLGRIWQKYNQLEEEPQYWECRAALEQMKGNISCAVEHYRKAIVKGAQIDTIEDSLEQLLQKFSLLNINPELNDEEETKQKRKIILDARNAFKSTIIQFAVQERTLKKKEAEAKKTITITPVRRSARLSLIHSGTPHIKLCSSLKETEINEETKFQNNSYLAVRYSLHK